MMTQVCAICSSSDSRILVDLGETPIAGDFSPTLKKRVNYRLRVRFCNRCSHGEIVDKLDPEILYDKSFSYISSSSPGLLEYFSHVILSVSKYAGVTSAASSWLDIGSNDGSLLDSVKNAGFRTFGIEPAASQAAISASSRKHTIYNGYCNQASFDYLGQSSFDVISILNTLSNTVDPLSILKLVASRLSEKGVVVVSTGDLESVCRGNIDYVYHEHNHYFSTTSLKKAAELVGLRIVRFERSFQKGGSVLALLKKDHSSFSTSAEQRLEPDFDYVSSIEKSLKRLEMAKVMMTHNFNKIQDSGIPILAFGASQSTTTLLSILGISDQLTAYIDDNPLKLLTHSPLGNKCVISTEMLLRVLDAQKELAIFPAAWRFFDTWVDRNLLNSHPSARLIPFSLN